MIMARPPKQGGPNLCRPCRVQRRDRWQREGRPCKDCGAQSPRRKVQARCSACRARRARRQCTEPGCDRPAVARGICSTHYAYLWRDLNGVPLSTGAWISPTRRRRIYERDGYICQLCFTPVEVTDDPRADLAPSLDHIVPRSVGGSDDDDNLACAHMLCNAHRGTKTREAWWHEISSLAELQRLRAGTGDMERRSAIHAALRRRPPEMSKPEPLGRRHARKIFPIS